MSRRNGSMMALTMKKEKHHTNSRIRRHSDTEKKTKKEKGEKEKDKDKDKDKDTDTESVVSTTPSTTDTTVVTPPPPLESKCPLRFLMTGMLEAEDATEGKKPRGCPLRRVQIWHTIPLCLLAIINLLLIIVALLGLAGYRIIVGIQRTAFNMAKSDLDSEPYAESVAGIDDGTLVAH